ncbi:MAG: HupE/UreJ family protein [Planctomycetota bacterium]
MILRLALLLSSIGSNLGLVHETDTSYSRLRFEGQDRTSVDWTVRFDVHDLDRVFRLDEDRDGFVQPEELGRALERISPVIEAGMQCEIDGEVIPFRSDSSELVDDESGSLFVDWTHRFELASSPRSAGLELRLFDRFGEWHRHFVILELRTESHRDVLTADRPSLEVELDSTLPPLERAWRAFASGWLEVISGLDHWLFLAALLLIARDRHEVMMPAVGWTGAAMAAIGGSVLEIDWLSGRVLESGAALSVIYLAIENVVAPAPKQRLPVAMLFGLVHGLAIGERLMSEGLSLFGRGWAITGYWLGGATGLLCLLAAAALLARRWRALPRAGSIAGSIALAAAGAWLFVHRFFL